MKEKTRLSSFFASAKEFTLLLMVVILVRLFGFGLYQVPSGSMETTMLVGERFFADKLTPLFSKPHRGTIISFSAPLYRYSHNRLIFWWQNFVWGPDNWTKRVIGIPGDKVKGVVEDGHPVVYINDKKMDEPYINKYPLIGIWKPSVGEMDWRSYDPSMPFNKQPFYRINPDFVLRHKDKPILREPGTPLQSRVQEMQHTTAQGNNFWNGSDEFYVELGPNQYWLMGDNRLGSHDCRMFGPISGDLIHGRILYRIWSVDSTESWWIVDLISHPIDFWKRVRWSRFFQRLH